VHGLHGKFTYPLNIAPSSRPIGREPGSSVGTVTKDRLTLLYGTNGTGKTSLLRLLFHALSPAGDRGHRDALKRICFREFSVKLTDGSHVKYDRKGESDIGGFVAEISLAPDAEPIVCDFGKSSDDWRTLASSRFAEGRDGETLSDAATLRMLQKSSTAHAEFISERQAFLDGLAAIGLNPIFLEDSRAITGDVLDREDSARAAAVQRARLRARARGADTDDDSTRRRDVDVEEALERVRLYLAQLTFAGTRAGSFRVDTVYVTVASAIIEHSSKVGRPNKRFIPELMAKVDLLNERAAEFQKYGLLPDSPMLDLAERLREAEDKHGPLLTQVLTPHLDGFQQRMDALQPGLRAVAAFVDALNSFLSGKRIEYRPGRDGLRIVDSQTDDAIDPLNLSSGEKQIVLLFSDVIALQDDTRLFLIDEPELSLNPDWQRALMPSLLAVTEVSGMQLIAATHSIEIMARYRDRRRRLEG
jgi:energy-coupling factor transporter ATP-binding protein EcfA2